MRALLASVLRHPVAELELRRQSRSELFFALRAVLAAIATVFAAGLVVSVELAPLSSGNLAGRAFSACAGLALLALVLVAPAYCAASFVAARRAGVVDALVLTGRPELGVVVAFWWSTAPVLGLSLLSLTPCMLVIVAMGGASPVVAVTAVAGLVTVAALLSSLSLLFALRSPVIASSMKTIASFALVGAPLALLAFAAVTGGDWAVVAVVNLLGWLLAAAALAFAGRRLARDVRDARASDVGDAAEELASDALEDGDQGTPSFSEEVTDPVEHLLAPTRPGPRAAGRWSAVVLLLASGTAAFDRVPFHVAATFVGALCGAWAAAAASEKLFATGLATDLATAGTDASAVLRAIRMEAALASRWPLALALLSFGARSSEGLISPQGVLLTALLVPGTWILTVVGAAWLRAQWGSSRYAAAVSLGLTSVLLGAGGVVMSLMSTPLAPACLLHPLALVAFLARMKAYAWELGAPLVAATALWCAAAYLAHRGWSRRIDRSFREPLEEGAMA